jgi:alkylation response protein AidB-like acyl-CoA dehydrogenase
MALEFSDEQFALRDTVRRYLADRAPVAYVRSVYEDPVHGTTPEVWKGLVDLGLTGILVPEANGGLGLGLADMTLVVEEMGRALHPGPFFSSAGAATLATLLVGNDDDHAALLPALASGERTASLALLEPGRGGEWRAPAATAAEGSGGWTVSGAKAHVPDGAAVDVLLVTAAAPDGLGLFAVEVSALTACEPEAALDGTRKQATIRLDGAAARRVGTGDATAALQRAVDRIAILTVVDGVGAADAALQICLDYARERVAFGKPIGSFQHVQRLCVEMYQAVEMCRAAGYVGAFTADAHEDDECHRVALVGKSYAGHGLVTVGNHAIQVHGGVGATWEHDIHLYYKRCLSDAASYGDAFTATDELAALVI